MLFAAVALWLHMAAPAVPDVNAQPAAASPAATDPFEIEKSSPRPAPNASDDPTKATLAAASLKTSENTPVSLSTVRVPPIQPATPVKVIYPESVPSRRNWLLLSIVQHGAATFDAYSTRQAVSSGARESDPLMRPFAQSPGIYAAIQGAPLVLDFAARRMQRSHNNFLRHSWWVPQSAATGLFVFSGVRNLNVRAGQ